MNTVDSIKPWKDRMAQAGYAEAFLRPMSFMQEEIDDLRTALQSAQPVAQPLTDEEIYAIVRNSFECVPLPYDIRLTRAIEKHHGIGAKE